MVLCFTDEGFYNAMNICFFTPVKVGWKMGTVRTISTLNGFMIFSIILTLFSISVSALDQVETDIELEFIDGTHLDIDVTLDVSVVTLPANGASYTKSDIQTLANTNPEMMGAIKISVKGLMVDQLKESFPESVITSLQELPTYSSGVFTDSYRLNFLPEFFSLNESVDADAFVNGFLDCGAYINYTYTLKSYAGWNQSYAFILPKYIEYKRTNGDVKQNIITWTVKTTGEPNDKDAQLTLLESNPTSTYSSNETIQVQFVMNCTVAEKPVFNTKLNGLTIAISSYDMYPDFLSNIYGIPADALRLSILENLTSWNQVKNLTFDPAFQQIKPIVENSSFNQTITPVFSWVNSTTISASDPFNVSFMDSNPPISANYQDCSVLFTICNISSRAVFGLINAGASLNISSADVNIGDNLQTLPYSYNGTIIFPNHVYLNNQNRYLWDESNPINGSFTSNNSPIYQRKNITSTYEIDVKSTDLNLLSFFTGRTEANMELHLREIQKRNITEVPFHFQLPRKIQIPLLNSDAFRICVEEGVFTDEDIKNFIDYQKTVFQSRSKLLFPLIKGNANFDQTVFDESLHWDRNISSMDAQDPVIISSKMDTAFPLVFEFSIIPPSLSIQRLNLSFSGINDQDVTYSMMFPKGIIIEADDKLDRAVVTKNAEGNMMLFVSFNANEGGRIDSVLLSMQPSVLYILGMFVPCIISVIITIILFFLVFFLRNKRKNMPPSKNEISRTNYDQEDYYIPPPPSSKRK